MNNDRITERLREIVGDAGVEVRGEHHPRRHMPAGLTTADAIQRARDESLRLEYPDHVPMRTDYGGASDA